MSTKNMDELAAMDGAPLPAGYRVQEFIPGVWCWDSQDDRGEWSSDGSHYGSDEGAVVAAWMDYADTLEQQLAENESINAGELPSLPPSLDEVHVYMGERSDDNTRWAAPNAEYFSQDDLLAYGHACAVAAIAQVSA